MRLRTCERGCLQNYPTCNAHHEAMVAGQKDCNSKQVHLLVQDGRQHSDRQHNSNKVLSVSALPTETFARCCVCSLVDPGLSSIAPAPERFALLCYSTLPSLVSLPAIPQIRAASMSLPSRHAKAVCLLPENWTLADLQELLSMLSVCMMMAASN